MDTDLKPIVKDSYLYIIKGTLNRIMFFEFDSIMNHLIRLHIKINETDNADEKLVITDKFYLYKQLWKAILETLYEKFLPHFKYEFKWEIEITPYTMMLCELSKENFSSSEFELQKLILNMTDENIENDFTSLIQTCGFDKIGLKEGLKNHIPHSLLPTSKKEELSLLFRLMNFPPLGELALFLNLYNANLKSQANKLSIAFTGVDEKLIPSFGLTESLHYSWFHIDHSTFQKHGFDVIKNHQALVKYKTDFEKINLSANDDKDKYKDELICPCCGEKQEITIPEELLQYKYLLANQALCKTVGLLYLDDFIENYKKNLSEKYYSFLPNINKVDNPECVILVEGESEESSIPLLAFRKRFILSHHNIQVYNSKSKEKLAADFLSMKANYPNRKIICLLDSDAIKEKNDIQRIVNDRKNQYRLVFIENGTFEDIFDLDLSIEILNELYPDGEKFISSDFDKSKDFLSNIKRLMFIKKKAQFDKVLFAKTISMRIDTEKFPKEIKEILDIAMDFTKPTNFIKK